MNTETANARDACVVKAQASAEDFAGWDFKWRVLKYHEVDNPADITSDMVPDEIVEVDGNGLLNAGIAILLDKLIGAGAATVYSNANAFIKVGNSNAAFSAAHTDLQGGTTQEKAMDATYPQRAGQTVTWQASFGGAEANFNWLEWGIKNGAGAVSGAVVLLNRKTGDLGTKVTGTWVFQGSVTIS